MAHMMMHMKPQYSTPAKILEMLATGFNISFIRSKKKRKALYNHVDIVWQSIDRKYLYQMLDRFHMQGLVEVIRESNARERIKITQKGRARVLESHFASLSIKKPRRWDKKWRMIVFDIPEKRRAARDSFRGKLKNLGFVEFQKSVFVYPYPCMDEINFVINFFDIEDYVYYVEAVISPDRWLRKHFHL